MTFKKFMLIAFKKFLSLPLIHSFTIFLIIFSVLMISTFIISRLLIPYFKTGKTIGLTKEERTLIFKIIVTLFILFGLVLFFLQLLYHIWGPSIFESAPPLPPMPTLYLPDEFADTGLKRDSLRSKASENKQQAEYLKTISADRQTKNPVSPQSRSNEELLEDIVRGRKNKYQDAEAIGISVFLDPPPKPPQKKVPRSY